MSQPTEYSWQALKRVCRFLRSAPRLVYTYPYQETEGVDVYTDTDWAGCPKTRKSTSGGSVMFGSHLIKHWSSAQTSVALSPGEAEFAGVIRGAGKDWDTRLCSKTSEWRRTCGHGRTRALPSAFEPAKG